MKCKPQIGPLATTWTIELMNERFSAIRWSLTVDAKLWSFALHTKGFESNPVDKRVLNNTMDGKQCTICFHVDNLWNTMMTSSYGGDQRCPIHGWRLIFVCQASAQSRGGVLGLIVDCGVTDKAKSPAAEHLLKHDESAAVDVEHLESFHSTFHTKLIKSVQTH